MPFYFDCRLGLLRSGTNCINTDKRGYTSMLNVIALVGAGNSDCLR